MKFSYKFLIKKITYKNCTIENLDLKDIEKIRNWRNQQKNILRQNFFLTKKEQKKYFLKVIKSEIRKKNPHTILFSFKQNEILKGYGGLVYISWENKRAELSYLLNTEDSKSKNNYQILSNIYIRLVKKFAFNRLRLNRLYTETFFYRPFHISILEKNGFKYEGEMKKHNIKKGKFINVKVHGLLNSRKRYV